MKQKEKAVKLLEQLNGKLDTIIGLLENKTIEKTGITDFSDDKPPSLLENSLRAKEYFSELFKPAPKGR